jgi:hypothetical protein
VASSTRDRSGLPSEHPTDDRDDRDDREEPTKCGVLRGQLGLIFLKYADSRFSQVEAELAGKSSGRRRVGKTDY